MLLIYCTVTVQYILVSFFPFPCSYYSLLPSFITCFLCLLCCSSSTVPCLFLSPLLCYVLHFAMVTTADPEHLSHLHHFIRYLIGSFQIKRSNCVYKSPLGFQALFLGHILLKSNTHPHTLALSGAEADCFS